MPQRDPLVIVPGELRHLVQIMQPVLGTPSSMGMSIAPASWNNLLSVGAAIYTAGGKETSMASQIVSQVSHVVKIRYTVTVIKAGYQVVFGVRTFNVQYVENVKECNRVLLLYCLEVDGGGQ